MSVIYECGNLKAQMSSRSSSEFRAAIKARKDKEAAAKVAAKQQAQMKYTQKGDFMHLAPTGNLSQLIRR